jgi:hypothetical protein
MHVVLINGQTSAKYQRKKCEKMSLHFWSHFLLQNKIGMTRTNASTIPALVSRNPGKSHKQPVRIAGLQV